MGPLVQPRKLATTSGGSHQSAGRGRNIEKTPFGHDESSTDSPSLKYVLDGECPGEPLNRNDFHERLPAIATASRWYIFKSARWTSHLLAPEGVYPNYINSVWKVANGWRCISKAMLKPRDSALTARSLTPDRGEARTQHPTFRGPSN